MLGKEIAVLENYTNIGVQKKKKEIKFEGISGTIITL
jgi:hypothetical protein